MCPVVICGEDFATEGERHNNQHQELCVIRDWLEDDNLVLEEGESVLTDVIAIGLDGCNRDTRSGQRRWWFGRKRLRVSNDHI
jgi:hypothetical protein